jgi:hypothetical protein
MLDRQFDAKYIYFLDNTESVNVVCFYLYLCQSSLAPI